MQVIKNNNDFYDIHDKYVLIDLTIGDFNPSTFFKLNDEFAKSLTPDDNTITIDFNGITITKNRTSYYAVTEKLTVNYLNYATEQYNVVIFPEIISDVNFKLKLKNLNIINTYNIGLNFMTVFGDNPYLENITLEDVSIINQLDMFGRGNYSQYTTSTGTDLYYKHLYLTNLPNKLIVNNCFIDFSGELQYAYAYYQSPRWYYAKDPNFYFKFECVSHSNVFMKMNFTVTKLQTSNFSGDISLVISGLIDKILVFGTYNVSQTEYITFKKFHYYRDDFPTLVPLVSTESELISSTSLFYNEKINPLKPPVCNRFYYNESTYGVYYNFYMLRKFPITVFNLIENHNYYGTDIPFESNNVELNWIYNMSLLDINGLLSNYMINPETINNSYVNIITSYNETLDTKVESIISPQITILQNDFDKNVKILNEVSIN